MDLRLPLSSPHSFQTHFFTCNASCLRSGVIWQVEKARRKWKTLNNAIIALLEDAHGKKELDVKYKNVSVSMLCRERCRHDTRVYCCAG